MAVVNLSPIGGAGAQFFDNYGNPLSGGLIYTYQAGTSTPQATYTAYDGLIQNSNPIVLDAAGRPPEEIWLVQNYSYKFVLKTSAEVLIGTWDDIFGINDSPFTNVANFTGDGSTTIFTLPVAPNSENWINVFINGVYQYKNTYTVSNDQLTFSEAPPDTSKIEVEY